MSIRMPWMWIRTSYVADKGVKSTYLADDQPYFNDAEMLESPWLAMMDMDSPRQVEKAKLIRELENVPGQTFQVKRASLTAVNGSAKGSEHLVLQLDHVPDTEELEQLLLGLFGGGVYNLYAKSRPRAKLLSYTLPGDPKYPRADDVDGRRAHDTSEDFETRLAHEALASMKTTNPKAYQYMGMMMLGKRLGVRLDAALMMDDADDNDDWEEKLIRERMKEDPEFKEDYLKAAMEAKFGKRRLSDL